MMSTGPLGGEVTLGFYLLNQPNAEEATMLWLRCRERKYLTSVTRHTHLCLLSGAV